MVSNQYIHGRPKRSTAQGGKEDGRGSGRKILVHTLKGEEGTSSGAKFQLKTHQQGGKFRGGLNHKERGEGTGKRKIGRHSVRPCKKPKTCNRSFVGIAERGKHEENHRFAELSKGCKKGGKDLNLNGRLSSERSLGDTRKMENEHRQSARIGEGSALVLCGRLSRKKLGAHVLVPATGEKSETLKEKTTISAGAFPFVEMVLEGCERNSPLGQLQLSRKADPDRGDKARQATEMRPIKVDSKKKERGYGGNQRTKNAKGRRRSHRAH